jgi:hypothetical protein
MRCVTSVRCSIKVNGELTEPFISTRGIRQGDLINPYLFLVYAEGLSCLVRKEEQVINLKGVRNGIMGPSISHLLFADDTIFFMRANVNCINSLNSILQTYSQGTGQRINRHKSTLFFGSHCPDHIKQRVMNSLEVYTKSTHSNYLGMPIYVGQ